MLVHRCIINENSKEIPVQSTYLTQSGGKRGLRSSQGLGEAQSNSEEKYLLLPDRGFLLNSRGS